MGNVNIVLGWIGLAVMFFLAAGALWVVGCVATARLLEKVTEKAELCALKELGISLGNTAYWFSQGDEQEVRDILELLGDSLARSGRFDSSNLRDLWRERRHARLEADAIMAIEDLQPQASMWRDDLRKEGYYVG